MINISIIINVGITVLIWRRMKKIGYALTAKQIIITFIKTSVFLNVTSIQLLMKKINYVLIVMKDYISIIILVYLNAIITQLQMKRIKCAWIVMRKLHLYIIIHVKQIVMSIMDMMKIRYAIFAVKRVYGIKMNNVLNHVGYLINIIKKIKVVKNVLLKNLM